MSPEHAALISLVVGVVVLAAVGGVRLAARFGLPGLLFYLFLGLFLGQDGPGGIHFDDPELATSLGFAALVVILAEGGLTTRPSTVRPVLAPAVILASFGVALSIGLIAVPLHLIAGIQLHTAVLIGAALAPTDSAAVFAVARGLRLPPRLQTLLEAESGFNDAPVIVLIVLLTTPSAAHMSPAMIVLTVAAQLIGGVLVGGLIGMGARWFLPRVALPAAGLYPVAVLALFLVTYGAAVVIHVSGFAAVYILALVLAASRLPHRRSVIGFIEGLTWAAQIGLFIMLGLLAVPSRAMESIGLALLAGAILLVLARPLSVFGSLGAFTRPSALTRLSGTAPIPMRWLGFISWAGLRGAVPIIFATIPLAAEAGTDSSEGELVFDVTLILVILLTILQAPTMPRLARRMGLASGDAMDELTVEAAPLDSLRAALLNLDVPPESRLAGTYVVELPLPPGAVVSLVVRGEQTMTPDRNTRIRTGDRLLIVTTDGAREATEAALGRVSRSGRLGEWTDPERQG